MNKNNTFLGSSLFRDVAAICPQFTHRSILEYNIVQLFHTHSENMSFVTRPRPSSLKKKCQDRRRGYTNHMNLLDLCRSMKTLAELRTLARGKSERSSVDLLAFGLGERGLGWGPKGISKKHGCCGIMRLSSQAASLCRRCCRAMRRACRSV